MNSLLTEPGPPQATGLQAEPIGGLNGGEVSAKLNRELALLVGSDEAYAYLADVFWYDWDVTP